MRFCQQGGNEKVYICVTRQPERTITIHEYNFGEDGGGESSEGESKTKIMTHVKSVLVFDHPQMLEYDPVRENVQ
jgi:hypothetical protein